MTGTILSTPPLNLNELVETNLRGLLVWRNLDPSPWGQKMPAWFRHAGKSKLQVGG